MFVTFLDKQQFNHLPSDFVQLLQLCCGFADIVGEHRFWFGRVTGTLVSNLTTLL